MKDEKILNEEILNDEEIEIVSGGRGGRTPHSREYDGAVISGDIEFLMKSLGYKGPIIDAWKEAGVTYTGKEYLIGNEKISRKDAYLYVMKKRGWNDTAIKFFDWENWTGGW